MEKEIVISTNFGAGISTWNDYPKLEQHPALIDYVKRGMPKDEDIEEIMAAHGVTDCYWGGMRDAEVVTVTGPYRIHEYDGSETVILASEEDYTW